MEKVKKIMVEGTGSVERLEYNLNNGRRNGL